MLDVDPHGPLPSQIYRRRRYAAIGIAVVVIALVAGIVAIVVANSTSSGTPTADNTAAMAASPAPAAPPPLPGETPGVKTPVVPGQQAPPPTPTPTAAVKPPPVLKEGDDCPDSTLAVKGITSAPDYAMGDQPKFTMVVTNIGLVACKRDVGAAVLSAYVYSLENTRLWSNLDCAPSNETLVKAFNPGEQVTTEVTWTGMGSAANCPLPREPIGPGTYNLIVQLGNLRSAPVPFILAEPHAAEPAPPPGEPAPPAEPAPAAPAPGG